MFHVIYCISYILIPIVGRHGRASGRAFVLLNLGDVKAVGRLIT